MPSQSSPSSETAPGTDAVDRIAYRTPQVGSVIKRPRGRDDTAPDRRAGSNGAAASDAAKERRVSTAKAQSGLEASGVGASASQRVQAGQITHHDEPVRPTLGQRLEAFISRLSTKNNFWHKVCSLIWLPYAFRSGITMKRLDSKTFSAVLPFKRINRNWYNAMAGAALLGNSEVAAGMYLFSECGSDYIVVCKEMKYRFLRPCMGPAVYHIVNAEDVKKKIAEGGEFNIDLELEIRQQMKKKGKELRVGRCEITFHCTPKSHFRRKSERARHRSAKRKRDRAKAPAK